MIVLILKTWYYIIRFFVLYIAYSFFWSLHQICLSISPLLFKINLFFFSSKHGCRRGEDEKKVKENWNKEKITKTFSRNTKKPRQEGNFKICENEINQEAILYEYICIWMTEYIFNSLIQIIRDALGGRGSGQCHQKTQGGGGSTKMSRVIFFIHFWAKFHRKIL